MAHGLNSTIAEGTAQIDRAAWNRLAAASDQDANPFVDHAFFLALEQSGCASAGTGWTPRHLVLRAEEAIVGILPLYEKAHSFGEYVFDQGWARAFEQAGGRYYPKLLSAVPFTPVTAPKLLAATAAERTAMLEAAAHLAETNGLSSVHATFLDKGEAELAEAAGWLMRTDTQYHWHNQGFGSFDDYVTTMSSRHRKVTRRERREALAGLAVKWLTGGELTEGIWDIFFAFYQDTGSRKWGHPYLNRAFFSQLSAAMSERIVLMFAYDGATPIAGTLSLLGKNRLYGRYWGCLREVPFLHFELCYYQAIDFAIAHKLAVVEAGAQGEHKLARGFVPVTTHSAHWIAHPGFRAAVARFLAEERTAVRTEQQALAALTPFRAFPG